MESDIIDDDITGEKHFIKYVDDTCMQVSIYCPLIAPRYLKDYIKEDNYKTCYEVSTIDMFQKYKDHIYVLVKGDEYYQVYKLVDYNMIKQYSDTEIKSENDKICKRKKRKKNNKS